MTPIPALPITARSCPGIVIDLPEPQPAEPQTIRLWD